MIAPLDDTKVIIMFCVVCGCESNTKTCSTKCRVALHRMNVRASDGVGYLYIIEFDGAVKFGASKDPVIRVRQVELSSGRVGGKLSMFGPFSGVGGIESKIHKLSTEWSICGEWYSEEAYGHISWLIRDEEELSGEGVLNAVALMDLNALIGDSIEIVSNCIECRSQTTTIDFPVLDHRIFLNAVDSVMNVVYAARELRATNAVPASLSTIFGAPEGLLNVSELDDDCVRALIFAALHMSMHNEISDTFFDEYKLKLGSHAAEWVSKCAGYISKNYDTAGRDALRDVVARVRA